MVEILIRRDCKQPTKEQSEGGPSGHIWICPDCKEKSYRTDGLMTHLQVDEYISLDEFKEMLK